MIGWVELIGNIIYLNPINIINQIPYLHGPEKNESAMKKQLSVIILSLFIFSAYAQPLDPGLMQGMKARSIGPAGMSGRVTAIDVNLQDPDEIYVGTASGGSGSPQCDDGPRQTSPEPAQSVRAQSAPTSTFPSHATSQDVPGGPTVKNGVIRAAPATDNSMCR